MAFWNDNGEEPKVDDSADLEERHRVAEELFWGSRLVLMQIGHESPVYLPCLSVCVCGLSQWKATEYIGVLTYVGIQGCRKVHAMNYECTTCGHCLSGRSAEAYVSALFFPATPERVYTVFERKLLDMFCAMRCGDPGVSAHALLKGMEASLWASTVCVFPKLRDRLKNTFALSVNVQQFRTAFREYRLLNTEMQKLGGFNSDKCLACTGPHGCLGVHSDGQFKTSCYFRKEKNLKDSGYFVSTGSSKLLLDPELRSEAEDTLWLQFGGTSKTNNRCGAAKYHAANQQRQSKVDRSKLVRTGIVMGSCAHGHSAAITEMTVGELFVLHWIIEKRYKQVAVHDTRDFLF